MTATTAADVYVDALHASQLFAEKAYQRDLDPRRVESMAKEFDRRLLGVLEVSDRGDGTFAILDGQHRHAVVLAVSGAQSPVVCQVYGGLTLEDEARLFHELNVKRKALSWWDHWRAQRGAGDEQVAAIEAVLAKHQLQVHPAQADGNVRATKALRVIVEDLGDLSMLDSVLVVAVSSFGRSPDAFDGAIMQGLAYVLGNYDPDELDVDRLVRALSEIPPRQIRARAASLREIHRGVLPRLCAAVIVERYNASRGPKVQDFLLRVPQLAKGGRAPTLARRAHQRTAQSTTAADPGAGTAAIFDELREFEWARDAEQAVDVDEVEVEVDDTVVDEPAQPPVEPARTVVTPAAHAAAMMHMCTCGHTERRHDGGDAYCLVGVCDCSTFTAAAAR